MPSPVFQRVDQAGYRLPLDERVLDDADTLLVFGLDHAVTEQEAAPEEIEALKQFLDARGHVPAHRPASRCRRLGRSQGARDGICPSRRCAGAAPAALRQIHALASCDGLGLPVENRYGLRPATIAEERTRSRAALHRSRSRTRKAGSTGVTTFNFHMHLPHYALTADTDAVRVLAKQPIDLSRPHPFTEAGNREFNTCLWVPPGRRPRRRHPVGRIRRCSARCSAPTKALNGSGGISRRKMSDPRRSMLAVRWLPLRSRGRRLAATPVHGHYPPGPDRTCAARDAFGRLVDHRFQPAVLESRNQGPERSTVGQSRRSCAMPTSRSWLDHGRQAIRHELWRALGVPFATGNLNPGRRNSPIPRSASATSS